MQILAVYSVRTKMVHLNQRLTGDGHMSCVPSGSLKFDLRTRYAVNIQCFDRQSTRFINVTLNCCVILLFFKVPCRACR